MQILLLLFLNRLIEMLSSFASMAYHVMNTFRKFVSRVHIWTSSLLQKTNQPFIGWFVFWGLARAKASPSK